MPRLVLSLVVVGMTAVSQADAQPNTREQKVRSDREKVLELDDWIYDDLEAGKAEARRTGKPLLVILRCIPCEACEGFDAKVLDRDESIRREMDRFVCVRIVKANSLDLAQFQFDYDLSFGAFFMHPDGTIYGRFGTRSTAGAEDSEKNISLEGFRKALDAALALHREYPANRALFAAKRGPRPEFAIPQDYPALKGKYQADLDYEGKVVQSCIHCHEIRDAQRRLYRDQRQAAPAEVIFPWPLPEVVGLELDPRETATVKSVERGSAAGRAGLRVGDAIELLDGQPMLSIADVQWVLHNASAADKLPAQVRRGSQSVQLNLSLEEGWRAASDISWRVTSWNLRRIATGGLKLKPLDDADRRRRLEAGAMALLVEHVGQYGDHAVAKQAGFQKGDVIVSFDGHSDLSSETALFAYVMQNRMPGEVVPVTVLRGNRRMDLKLRMQ